MENEKSNQKEVTTLSLVSKLEREIELTLDIKAELEEYKAYKNLTIEGLEDKEGAKLVTEARKKVKKTMARIEEERKTLKAPILGLGKTVDSKANEVKDELKLIKDDLEIKEKAHAELVEQEKNRKAEEERKRVQALNDKLIDLGAVFGGTYYELGNAVIIIDDIPGMEPEEFELIFSKFESEKIRLKEEEEKVNEIRAIRAQEVEELGIVISVDLGKMSEDEYKQITEEKKAEKKKAEEEAAAAEALKRENEIKAAELDAKEKALEEERKKQEKESAELKAKLAAFEQKEKEEKAAKEKEEKAKIDAENEAKIEVYKNRSYILKGVYVSNSETLDLSYNGIPLITEDEIVIMSDEDFAKFSEKHNADFDAKVKKDEEVRIAKEESLKVNIARINDYIAKLESVEVPEMEENEIKIKMNSLVKELYELFDFHRIN